MAIAGVSYVPTPLTFTWVGVGDGQVTVGSPWGQNDFIVGPNDAQIVAGDGSKYNITNTFNYNKFFYDQGDGNAVIDVTNAQGEIDLAQDVLPDSVIFQTTPQGDLLLKFLGDSTDSIDLKNDLYLTPYSGAVSRVSYVVFGDGSTLPISLVGANAIKFTWTDSAVGSNYGANIFDLGPGGATVTAGNGSQGGQNWNTFQFDRGDAAATVNLNGGQGQINMMADIMPSSLTYQANAQGDLKIGIKGDPTDSLTIKGDMAQSFYGPTSLIQTINFGDGTFKQITFNGPNALVCTWTGSAVGCDYSANVFNLAQGGNTIIAGNGSQGGIFGASDQNTFNYSLGDGPTTVTLNGGVGTLNFGPGITRNDLLFQADPVGDVTISLKGNGGDSITFQNDLGSSYFGAISAVNQINFSDGTTQNLGMVSYQNYPITFTYTATVDNTVLIGSDYGSNIFNLAPGGDQVQAGNGNQGGNGQNTFNYAAGDGPAVVDMNLGVGKLVLAPTVQASDIYLQADSAGDLTVKFHSDSADSVQFLHDLSNNWWGASSAMSEIDLADGSKLAVGEPGYYQGSPLVSQWYGTGTDSTYTSSGFGTNVFNLAAANDTVVSTTADTVNGGSGNDTVHANGGSIQVNASSGSTVLDGTAQATVAMANGGSLTYAGTGTANVTVTSNVSITIQGASNDQISTAAGTTNTIKLDTGSTTVNSQGADSILGGNGSGTDVINGGAGDMSFIGGSNTANLQIGTGGADVQFGPGHALVTEYPSSGASIYDVLETSSTGDATIASFRSGIDFIRLQGFGNGEVQSAVANETNNGTSVSVSFSSGERLTLTGMTSLAASDFKIAA